MRGDEADAKHLSRGLRQGSSNGSLLRKQSCSKNQSIQRLRIQQENRHSVKQGRLLSGIQQEAKSETSPRALIQNSSLYEAVCETSRSLRKYRKQSRERYACLRVRMTSLPRPRIPHHLAAVCPLVLDNRRLHPLPQNDRKPTHPIRASLALLERVASAL